MKYYFIVLVDKREFPIDVVYVRLGLAMHKINFILVINKLYYYISRSHAINFTQKACKKFKFKKLSAQLNRIFRGVKYYY